MPPLTNARHERFAQGLAKGLSASAAYAQAGYKPHDGNASMLRGNQQVQARVQELLQNAGRRVELSKARVLQEYARIAVANKPAIMRKLMAGEALAEDEEAVLDYERVPTRDGTVVTKTKMESKIVALEALAKHLRLFDDRASGGGLNIVLKDGEHKREVRQVSAAAEPHAQGRIQIVERASVGHGGERQQ